MKASLVDRVGKIERHAPRAVPAVDLDQWCEQALGCTFDDVDSDDLARVEQLLHEAPDYAHPLVLRACIARPEDREPPMPRTPRPATIDADSEWSGYSTWQRRRWGYMTAEDDPEAAALAGRIEAWAVSPDRAYLRGADLRLLFARLGVEQSAVGYLELQRLINLCAVLDVLALEYPTFEAPCEVFWAVLGWEQYHLRRTAMAVHASGGAADVLNLVLPGGPGGYWSPWSRLW